VGRAQEPYPFSSYGRQYERAETQKLHRQLPKSGSPVKPNEVITMANSDPFKTNGGNGGYSKRTQVKNPQNPQKAPASPKRAVDYTGRDAIRGFQTKKV
jgi:hypothetical protein